MMQWRFLCNICKRQMGKMFRNLNHVHLQYQISIQDLQRSPARYILSFNYSILVINSIHVINIKKNYRNLDRAKQELVINEEFTGNSFPIGIKR
jgi:hypothetical protein